jgi:hypothetical protein
LFATAAACGDGVTIPGRAAGYYRLVSVNGQPLPYVSPPSSGSFVEVTRGDLVLRPNGTFRHGLGSNVGFGLAVDGTYRLSDGELLLYDTPQSGGVAAQMSGDSITVTYFGPTDQSLRLTYRRTPLAPTTMPSPRYRLRSIDGRTTEPLVAYDTTIGDNRSVGYVLFDSLDFSDGVFFRRHRAESAIGYTNGQQTTASGSEWTTWGAYESGSGWVVLFPYRPPPSTAARDSLSITGDTLVRRTPLVTGVQEERYTRP